MSVTKNSSVIKELMTPIITNGVISTIIHLFRVLWSTSVTATDSALKYSSCEKYSDLTLKSCDLKHKELSDRKLF